MSLNIQLKKFIFIGIITVTIDYLIYTGLFFLIHNTFICKSIGFISGTIFSFVANRNFTFKVRNQIYMQLSKFILMYIISLIINIFTNSTLLEILIYNNLKVQISFIVATFITATLNFLGMKYFVFKN